MRAQLPLVLIVVGLWLDLPSARGQNAVPAEAQREVAAQNRLPPFAAPGAVVSPGGSVSLGTVGRDAGSDFGEQRIVQRRAQVEPWSVVADVELFHTDNVALTPTNTQQDWYLRYGLAVAYTNRVKGPVFISLSLQQYAYRYSEFDIFDFDLTQFEGGLLLQAPWLADAFFFAQYQLQRITEPGLGSAIYTNQSIELGVQKVWKISRGQQVFAGLSANLAVATDPRSSQRNEYVATLGYSLRLTEQINASFSYSAARYDYSQGGRGDWNNILALGFGYEPTDWLRLGVNATYTHNDSNTAFANYDSFVPGCSIALRMAF